MDFSTLFSKETLFILGISLLITIQIALWQNRKKKLPWVNDVYEAFILGGELRVYANPKGWNNPDFEHIYQVQNPNVSIIYLGTNGGDGHKKEILDISVTTKVKFGGLIVRFVDGVPFDWRRASASNYYPLNKTESNMYKDLLIEVRSRVT